MTDELCIPCILGNLNIETKQLEGVGWGWGEQTPWTEVSMSAPEEASDILEQLM